MWMGCRLRSPNKCTRRARRPALRSWSHLSDPSPWSLTPQPCSGAPRLNGWQTTAASLDGPPPPHSAGWRSRRLHTHSSCWLTTRCRWACAQQPLCSRAPPSLTPSPPHPPPCSCSTGARQVQPLGTRAPGAHRNAALGGICEPARAPLRRLAARARSRPGAALGESVCSPPAGVQLHCGPGVGAVHVRRLLRVRQHDRGGVEQWQRRGRRAGGRAARRQRGALATAGVSMLVRARLVYIRCLRVCVWGGRELLAASMPCTARAGDCAPPLAARGAQVFLSHALHPAPPPLLPPTTHAPL